MCHQNIHQLDKLTPMPVSQFMGVMTYKQIPVVNLGLKLREKKNKDKEPKFLDIIDSKNILREPTLFIFWSNFDIF